MTRHLALAIECGETTCATEPGKFCRFFGAIRFGQEPVCMLFPSDEGAYTPLDDSTGWSLRCKACREAEK